MKYIATLAALLERICHAELNKDVSRDLVCNVLDVNYSNAAIWIDNFGDPLTSLAGAKAIAEHLGLDWHHAMSAGATALDSKSEWCLPEVAPKAIAWMLNRLIDDAVSLQRSSPRLQ
jgi:hypothetical protein